MDEMKLKKDIEAQVAAIFSEKEEAEMREKTEQALQKAAVTIEDLTNALEERNTELEKLEVTISENDTNVSDLETELEAARQEIESVKEQLTEKKTELDEIKKDRAADVRMAELNEAGVVQRNEEVKANQTAKVREMSDDDFAAYKDELISIRQAVLDELAAAANDTKEEETVEEQHAEENSSEEENEETAEEETSEEEEEETLPAEIDPGRAVFAALNMDYRPTNEMVEKYAELGKAMAEEIKKKSR